MAKHLVFYDGNCGFCDYAVQFLIKRDTQKQFVFAPLQGITAKTKLKDLPDSMKNEDTLILIENYQQPQARTYILGKGALRISWLLGGWMSIFGIFSWLPSWSVNWVYKLIARNRHKLFPSDSCVLPSPETRDQFLP